MLNLASDLVILLAVNNDEASIMNLNGNIKDTPDSIFETPNKPTAAIRAGAVNNAMVLSLIKPFAIFPEVDESVVANIKNFIGDIKGTFESILVTPNKPIEASSAGAAKNEIMLSLAKPFAMDPAVLDNVKAKLLNFAGVRTGTLESVLVTPSNAKAATKAGAATNDIRLNFIKPFAIGPVVLESTMALIRNFAGLKNAIPANVFVIRFKE